MDGPRLLNVETTTRCNAHCVYCVRDIVGSFDMPLDIYKSCVDAFPKAEEMWPHGIGEPLLYPHIIEAIEYAAAAGMKVILYSNCTLLDKEMAHALVDAGVTRMVFSVDAADAETYAKLRPGLNWKCVVDNVKYFCSISSRPLSIARITVTPENRGQQKEIAKFWRGHGVDAVKFRPEVFMPPLDFAPLWSCEKDTVDCRAPHSHFIVRVNGDVVLCCRDYWAHYKMGNVNEQHPVEIWNSEIRTRLRKSVIDGEDYPRLCDLCMTPHARHNG